MISFGTLIIAVLSFSHKN
ncbi:putative holin-like toxin [Oceanobacillus sp. 1P07AA]